MASKKRSHTQIDDALAMKQTLAIANLLGKRGIVVSGSTASSPAMSIHSFPLVQFSIPTTVGAGASCVVYPLQISPLCGDYGI
jgi:hypothetical protein